jgi:hypothetical protein
LDAARGPLDRYAAEHLEEPGAIIINALLAMAVSLVVFFFIPSLRQQ